MQDTENEDTTEPTETVKILGPYHGATHYLIVNGCVVPHVELFKTPGLNKETGKRFEWMLMLDKRSAVYVTTDEIMGEWGFILAQAMAVAAGYTHHGEGSIKANPFNQEYVETATCDDDLDFD